MLDTIGIIWYYSIMRDQTKEHKKNHIKIDLDIFKSKYLLDNYTIPECAVFFDCGLTTIVRFCKKHRIKKDKSLIGLNISKKTLRNPQTQYICELYTKGLTRKKIAKKLDISLPVVNGVLKRGGITKTSERKKEQLIKIKASKDELEDLYLKQNKSLDELTQYFNVGHSALRGALRRYDIHKPESLRVKLVIEKFIKTGKANTIEGLTIKDIANKFNISITSIHNLHGKIGEGGDIMGALEEFSVSGKSSIELVIEKELSLEYLNKKIITGYKPDFKVSECVFLNTDGLYWHSSAIKKDNRYHFTMRKTYEEMGLRILQFREDEVLSKIDIVRSIVNGVKNQSTKIYGRKCKIKKITNSEASVFLEKNHLMGKISAKHVGLYYEGDLVCILSYRAYKKALKVDRFCNIINTSVLGGFSKLLKYVETTENPSKVDYWVDLRYGTGSYLENLGFVRSHETLGWRWTDLRQTYNRMFCKAKDGITENKNARRKKLVRIYDAGQRLYTKTTNKKGSYV